MAITAEASNAPGRGRVLARVLGYLSWRLGLTPEETDLASATGSCSMAPLIAEETTPSTSEVTTQAGGRRQRHCQFPRHRSRPTDPDPPAHKPAGISHGPGSLPFCRGVACSGASTVSARSAEYAARTTTANRTTMGIGRNCR